MKKKCLGLLMIMLIGMNSVVFGLGKSPYEYLRTMTIFVDETHGEANFEPLTMEVAPYISNGRTLVPLRALGDALGATVGWNAEKREAAFKLGVNEVVVVLDSTVAYVNGKATLMEAKPEIRDGRTFVPLRFISENLGAYVDYDSSDRSIFIEYIETAKWKVFEDSTGYKFSLPSDWSVFEDEDDYSIKFKSPKGSQVYVTGYTEITVKEFVDEFKKDMAKDGVEIHMEFPIYENDPDVGYKVIYKIYDSEQNTVVFMPLSVYATDYGVWVGFANVKEENLHYDMTIIDMLIEQ